MALIPAGGLLMAGRVRAECRREVGQPRAQFEALVAERYGEPPEDSKCETRYTKPTPEDPSQAATATRVKMGPSEPLDGRDPNP